MQYFCKRQSDTAFAVLLRLLNRNVVFIHTVSRHLKVTDVIEMAVMVSYNLRVHVHVCCINSVGTEFFLMLNVL